ncbi:unnamed protein product, partial [marine sediment metagenome]
MRDINRIELYKLEIEKDYVFKNKVTDEIVIGKLKDVKFKDGVCDTDEYVVNDIKNG